MTPNTILAFDGTEQSISEWALDYGIPADLIITRLGEGQSVEAAITTMMPARKPTKRPKVYTHEGETMSIRKWAKRIGIPVSTLTQRLARGTSFADAINPDLNYSKAVRTYTHDGETKSLRQWAEAFGINYPTLRYRVIDRGMSIGDALTMPRHAKPTRSRKQSGRQVNGTAPIVIHVAGVTITITIDGRPGVSSDLAASKGTGAGGNSQAIQNITFEEKAE